MPKKPTPVEPSGLPYTYQVKDASTAKNLAKDLNTIGYQAQADGDTVSTDATLLTVNAMLSPSSVASVLP